MANKKLQSLKLQSQLWISAFLITAIILKIIFHDVIIYDKLILWTSIFIGVAWWGWTMYAIKALINQRIEEYKLILDIKDDIKNIKKDITEK